MKKFELLAASAFAMIAALPAAAQTAPDAAPQESAAQDSGYGADIVVTAQRQSQTLQEVPIAVSAFSAETLQAQQIENASDLQLTLPNVNFSKGNFTGSSFTIRGIGDLCVGTSCDSATAIHINGSPLLGTRLFETEYFDLERIEVLRGPQGTLFGRSATSGVVNVITAKPNLDKFEASAEGEYANFDAYKARAMINIPLGDTLAVRAAGFYLKRDGYTLNRFNGDRIDGRDMYAVRGSIRWEPSVDTTVDLMGYYFREDDNRLRIQKQQCQRDPTGVLGCLNGRRDSARTNTNSTFTGTLGSSEFLAFRGIPASLGLNSLYGPDGYSGFADTTDVREVATAFTPEYFTDELQIQGRIEHNFGDVRVQLTGLYQEAEVDSRQDYNLGVASRAGFGTALGTVGFFAANGVPGFPGSQAYFAPIVTALFPSGPGGDLCTSDTVENGLGAFGGQRICNSNPLAFDRSVAKSKSWSAEAIISSDFDGPFNFLLGGIYVDASADNTDYYVNAFAIDYVAAVLGSFTGFGTFANPAVPDLPPAFLATPFFRNNTATFGLQSYGIFGEAYVNFNDRLKLTLGVRYNNDRKELTARSTLASFLVPYGQTGDAFNSPFAGAFDGDPSPNAPGIQSFQVREQGFDEFTGRAVLDYKITDDNLIYASYSRGYKSGGINPPVQLGNVPDSFAPEQVDAFEIGSKNTFGNGAFTFNLTGFYYKYKKLQLSRIVFRTSINDNVDADIWGIEAESIVRPGPGWAINMGASYLHTEVKSSQAFVNQRDPGGGRADAVIIKDITNGSNCAVIPTVAGNAAASNTFVNNVNAFLSTQQTVTATPTNPLGLAPRTTPGTPPLRGTTPFLPDSNIASTGAFSVCGYLTALAGSPFASAGSVQVLGDGVAVSIKGNELPQAPVFKASVGVQKTFEFGNGMSFVPRADLTYTGESFGNIFNGRINKVEGYEQLNAQIQLNGADQRWFVRGFIQNILDNNATTGLYLTDQSSGLFTNIFTLDPRRYGVAAGFKF